MDPETNETGDDWGDGRPDLSDRSATGEGDVERSMEDSWDHEDPDSDSDSGEYDHDQEPDHGSGSGDDHDQEHESDWEDADEGEDWDDQDLSDVDAPDEPMEFKRRLEAAPVEAAPIQWKLWGPVLVAIALAAGAAAAWAVLSGDNNRGDLQVISTQELLTPECTWTIAYEMENTTDVPLQAVDTRVVANGLTLYVTQAAPDVVVGPNSTFTNTIVYGLPDCPANAEDIDHGPLEVFYANSEGRGETLAADF